MSKKFIFYKQVINLLLTDERSLTLALRGGPTPETKRSTAGAPPLSGARLQQHAGPAGAAGAASAAAAGPKLTLRGLLLLTIAFSAIFQLPLLSIRSFYSSGPNQVCVNGF